jgi:hypothetical protein
MCCAAKAIGNQELEAKFLEGKLSYRNVYCETVDLPFV